MRSMADVPIPTYAEMMLPTLEAIEELGSSGTRDEINGATIQQMGLSADQLAVAFPPEADRRARRSYIASRGHVVT